jgi:hypothetical protein
VYLIALDPLRCADVERRRRGEGVAPAAHDWQKEARKLELQAAEQAGCHPSRHLRYTRCPGPVDEARAVTLIMGFRDPVPRGKAKQILRVRRPLLRAVPSVGRERSPSMSRRWQSSRQRRRARICRVLSPRIGHPATL